MRNPAKKTPAHIFTIGDIVIYTNEYGVNWGEREIVGYDDWGHGPRYHIAPSDTPWYTIGQQSLKKASPDRQAPAIAPPGFAELLGKTQGKGEELKKLYARYHMDKQEAPAR